MPELIISFPNFFLINSKVLPVLQSAAVEDDFQIPQLLVVDSLNQPSINGEGRSTSSGTTQASTSLPVTTACPTCPKPIANAILLLPKDIKPEQAAVLVNSLPAENATGIVGSIVIVDNVPVADIIAEDISQEKLDAADDFESSIDLVKKIESILPAVDIALLVTVVTAESKATPEIVLALLPTSNVRPIVNDNLSNVKFLV